MNSCSSDPDGAFFASISDDRARSSASRFSRFARNASIDSDALPLREDPGASESLSLFDSEEESDDDRLDDFFFDDLCFFSSARLRFFFAFFSFLSLRRLFLLAFRSSLCFSFVLSCGVASKCSREWFLRLPSTPPPALPPPPPPSPNTSPSSGARTRVAIGSAPTLRRFSRSWSFNRSSSSSNAPRVDLAGAASPRMAYSYQGLGLVVLLLMVW